MVSFKGFNPETDIPSLTGKVILITGGLSPPPSSQSPPNESPGTSGLGRSAILTLASHNPSYIYFTGRSSASALSLISAISPVPATFLECDLTSIASMRSVAKMFTHDRLDVFIANAGVMAVDGLTQDGLELQFGVNHVGNATLLMALLPIMQKTAEKSEVRFVSVTSLGYAGHPKKGIEFETLHSLQEHLPFGTWSRYGQSKLANIVLAKELERRCPAIKSVVVHPGVIATNLVTGLGFWKRMFVYVTNPSMMTVKQGGYNTAWAAAGDVKRDETVAFYEPVGKANKGDDMCFSEDLGKKLWQWTEEKIESVK
ncbi:related to alcohol dehydrogenase homolog Bli-4 [Fusarium proliferatum ET1]|uniref:Related to alcohol dehydrogenase homolog Bli-4 n=1 Tax=Fusarium proliferatum (strain ET1) TaxID=1227346 RepID=A0A1L7W1S3_FUSPR|nr:related to alcohol dehydrogenase homolog Bli-4 [Fusarium proliferatum ET1]CZR46599.1 related to alcohol dehydrogenase homolog Bli-4 [Fusarium proliferatum ET1]